MNRAQKILIKELKEQAKKLGHSPIKREIPKLAYKCYKSFASFNKAKEKAGLEVKNVRIINFPKNVFRKDKDLTKIIAYLTFDGHLYKDLSAFFLSSRRIENLKEFEKIIKRKFNMNGKYKLNSGGIKNNTHKFIVFNKKISKELYKLGAPKGDKSIQKFNVPKWVSSSKNLSREYLKIAFLCEGSNKEEKGRTARIQINTAKTEDKLDSGLRFMNNLREMLKNLGINTTKCYVTGKRLRKTDNKISKNIKFRIDIKDNHKFIKQIAPFFKWG